MKTLRSLVVGVALLMVVAQAKAAPLANGGFETGDFTGWTTIGDALVALNTLLGTGPGIGTFGAFLSTASNAGDSFNFSGTDAVSAAALEAFLGLPAGALTAASTGTAIEGSAIRQTFMADAGNEVILSFNFLTDEDTNVSCPPDCPTNQFNDFAFVTLNGTVVAILADTFATFGPSPTFGGFLDFLDETGAGTISLPLSITGTYTLGIGLVDVGDNEVASGLIVDNVFVTPEPGTVALFSTGLLGLLGYGWRRRKQQTT